MEPWVIVLVGLAAFAIGAVALRKKSDACPRIRRFLESRGVNVQEVELATATYGWPGYRIVFATSDELRSFRDSEAHRALLAEIGEMHRDLERSGQTFDPEFAVELAGPES